MKWIDGSRLIVVSRGPGSRKEERKNEIKRMISTTIIIMSFPCPVNSVKQAEQHIINSFPGTGGYENWVWKGELKRGEEDRMFFHFYRHAELPSIPDWERKSGAWHSLTGKGQFTRHYFIPFADYCDDVEELLRSRRDSFSILLTTPSILYYDSLDSNIRFPGRITLPPMDFDTYFY